MATRTHAGERHLTEGPGGHLSQAVSDVQSAVEHGQEALRAVKDSAMDKVESVQNRVGDTVDSVTDAYMAAKKRVTNCASSVDDFIRERPYRALAIGIGAGLLLGVIFRRK